MADLHNKPVTREPDGALRRRLTEAEDTLYAIRSGEVDAVVVEGPSGQQVYTLESPDEPFRIFVEQMQEGALTLNGEGSIIYCNRFFADLLDCPVEQVRGQAVQRFIAAEDLEVFRELFAAAARHATHGECRIVGGKGERLPVQLAFNRLPAEDQPMFGVVVTDLTERERAKQLEAQRQAAEQANVARDRFLAVVSHELRTPLHAITGWTQVLRRRGDLPASVAGGLEIIERNAWTQSQLIEDLLDVSGVLAGKLRLHLQPVDLNSAIEAAVAAVQPAAQTKHIRIHTTVVDGALPVRGDPDRLQQVVGNLLGNAVKFTPPGGEIHVRLRKAGPTAEINVADTGMGIAAEFLPHLFELYRQMEDGNSRHSGGLGLGLAIVKELTDLHGGEVGASSPGLNRGATFTVSLPLLEKPAAGDRSPEPLDEGCAAILDDMHLLIVEDEPDARLMLAHALESNGAHVLAVGSAAEALELIERERIDLLISDIGLPESDGVELIRRIRAAGHTSRELPAIALTAFAGREDRREALLAGYQAHLPKPIDNDELCTAIASLAGRP